MVLLSEHSLVELLCGPGEDGSPAPGQQLPCKTHLLYPDLEHEGPSCGIIPLGAACRSISTRGKCLFPVAATPNAYPGLCPPAGLQWDMQQQCLVMGGLISTSNRLLGVPCTLQAGAGARAGGGESREAAVVVVRTSDPVLYTCDFRL